MAFKKGEVSNPKGRPKGAKNKATLYREQLESIGPLAMERLRDRIEEGDTTAMKIWFDKVLPSLKQVDVDANVKHSLDDLTLDQLMARHEALLAEIARLKDK